MAWMTGRRVLMQAGLSVAAAPALRGGAYAQSAGDAVPLLIFVFLRGGMDGLHALSPASDGRFHAMRPPELRSNAEGPTPGHRLDASAELDFRLHPAAAPLAAIWRERRMAIWPAAGLTASTRSHFEAQEIMARGQAGRGPAGPQHGWMGGWLAAYGGGRGVRGIAAQGGLPGELRGAEHIISAPSLAGGLPLPGGAAGTAMLEALYAQGNGPAALAGRAALANIGFVEGLLPRDAAGRFAAYAPAPEAQYNMGQPFARSLATVAQLAKLHQGLAAAQVDLGGWDTHDGQAGRFSTQMRVLAEGLAALDRDLATLPRRWTVLVASEFGRRLRSNASGGTDHGRAGMVFAFGKGFGLGGQFGPWPGLATEALADGVDVAVASDYRAVFGAVLCDLAPRVRSPFA